MTESPQAKGAQLELAQTRESLRVSQQHFRLLVESVRDYAIFMLDPKGYVATWNRGAERIKGYAAHEIIGRHFSAFYPQEDIDRGKCEMELEVAERDGRFEDEDWRKRKDGSLFWANVIITALRNESGELVGFAKVARDLTERRRAEDERIRLAAETRAREEADAANRAKDEFLAHISHELRTPLNAILGWARLLGSGLTEERRERATLTIERNADVMRQLIDDLLDVSSIVTGRMRLRLEPVDLALVVERAIESIAPTADKKGVRVTSKVDPSAVAVLGDATRLEQVVWNLLTNAVKFTAGGGSVELSLQRRASSVELAIADTGVGLAAEDLPHVFETFWQKSGASGSGSGSRGLGLGLSICKKLVDLHGGRIEVTSEGVGRGTTFTLALPIAPLRPSSDAEPGRSRPEMASRLRGVRVLVVEDERDARDLVRTVLEDCGAIVATAGDVPSALASIEDDVPDLLLSDIGLPGESGYDLLRHVRALPPERGGLIPAAALTAFAQSHDRMQALAAGFMVHIPKPVEPRELIMIVSAMAGQVRPRA